MGQVTRIDRSDVMPAEGQTEATPGLPTEHFNGHPVDSFEADAGRTSAAGEGQRAAGAALYAPTISDEEGAKIDGELSTLKTAINELKGTVPPDQLKERAAKLADVMTRRWAEHLAAKFTSQMHKSETTT